MLESLVMTPSSGEQKGNRRECGTCPCGSGEKIEHNVLFTGAWRKREEAFSLASCRYDDRAHTYGLLSDTMTSVSCC